jgi:hypothetical protein
MYHIPVARRPLKKHGSPPSGAPGARAGAASSHFPGLLRQENRKGSISMVHSYARHDIPEETAVNWNRSIRKIHRWLSIVFTVAVVVNISLNVLPLASDELVTWIGLLTLLPLTLLLVTGLYLFVLPYTTRKDQQRSTDA